MAELPEIERYRLVLSPHITGREITGVEVNRAKSINVPIPEFIAQVQGERISEIDRRAKHLIFRLSSGEELLLHLMIGGWIFLGDYGAHPVPQKQVILSFGERKLYFVGLRLGYLHLLSAEKILEKLAGLGPEPLDPAFRFEDFQGRMRDRSGSVKSILVDPKFIAGIGSCYSDEICFQAKLRPFKSASELTEEQTHFLFHAIKPVLTRAIEIGGYMDYPLYAGDEKTGSYNDHFLVYERENQPCQRCGTRIEKIQISSRKSFFCPGCQE